VGSPIEKRPPKIHTSSGNKSKQEKLVKGGGEKGKPRGADDYVFIPPHSRTEVRIPSPARVPLKHKERRRQEVTSIEKRGSDKKGKKRGPECRSLPKREA